MNALLRNQLEASIALTDTPRLPRKPDAIDRAIASMGERAKASVNALLDALTDEMIAQPWRINSAITGMSCWPPEDPLPDLLRWCRDLIADETDTLTQSLRPSLFRIEMLRAAESALIRMGAERGKVRRELGVL